MVARHARRSYATRQPGRPRPPWYLDDGRERVPFVRPIAYRAWRTTAPSRYAPSRGRGSLANPAPAGGCVIRTYPQEGQKGGQCMANDKTVAAFDPVTGEPSMLQVTVDVVVEDDVLAATIARRTHDLGVAAEVMQEHGPSDGGWPVVRFTGAYAGLEALLWRYEAGDDPGAGAQTAGH